MDAEEDLDQDTSARATRMVKPVVTGKQVELFDDDLEETSMAYETTSLVTSSSKYTGPHSANMYDLHLSSQSDAHGQNKRTTGALELGGQSSDVAGEQKGNIANEQEDPAEALRRQRIAQRAARLRANEEREEKQQIYRQEDMSVKQHQQRDPRREQHAAFKKETGLSVETSKMDHREVFGERASVADGLLDIHTKKHAKKKPGLQVAGALDLDAGTLARAKHELPDRKDAGHFARDRTSTMPLAPAAMERHGAMQMHDVARLTDHEETTLARRGVLPEEHPPEKRYSRHKMQAIPR
jgi:hypothetical protein